MSNLGDFQSQQSVYCYFNTHKADGTPITLAGTPAISVYKDDGTTETTTGPTLTVDFDGRTGLHCVKVATTDAFYAVGHDYKIVITTGTVDSVSVVGTVVGEFSIENRPVNATKIGGTAQTGRDIGASVLVGDKTGFSLSTAGILAIWHQALADIVTASTIGKLIKDYLDAAISSRSTYAGGAVASVTAGVTVTTNNDKTGYSLSTAPPTAVAIRQEIDSNSTQLAAIKAKTDALPAIWLNP